MADFSRFTGIAENGEVSRQQAEPQLRPQQDQESDPTYYRKTLEREGNSEWSGGSGSGGVWAGRSM
jgi:hypothetical protein